MNRPCLSRLCALAAIAGSAALPTSALAQEPAETELEWVAFEGSGAAQAELETRIAAQCGTVRGPNGRGALRVVVPDMEQEEQACAFSIALPALGGEFNAVRLWVKGTPQTKRLEVAFRTPEGNYGTELRLSPDWQLMTLRARDAGPLLGTAGGRLTLSRATRVRFCFGRWQGHTGGPHEVSIGPIIAVHSPMAEPPPPVEHLERPEAPLPLQPFTVELLDLARGEWVFSDALGQNLRLPGPVFAQAFGAPAIPEPRLAYLCCDPEFPEDAEHAVLHVVSPIGRQDGVLSYLVEEPYFGCAVIARPAADGVTLCELRDITLGPATTGDRYVAGLYLLSDGQAYPLYLAPDGGEKLQVRLSTDRVGHVFTGSEPVTVTVAGLCPGPQADCALSLQLTDYATGEVVWSGSRALICKAGARTAVSLVIPLDRYGVFELVAEGGPEPAGLRLCRIPTARQIDPEASAIGMNIFQQQIWWYTYQVPLMAKAGVHWIRPWLAWENVWSVQQPAADVWDTRALDAALRRLAAFDMRYQAILFGAPRWATGNAGLRAPPQERLDLWSAYVRRLVDQYKDRIDCWEVWNEPDLMWQEQTRHSGEHYVAVLKAAWEAARGADPDCKVLGLSHAGYMDWLDRVGRLGAGGYFDIATLHSYAPPADYCAAIRQRREVLARHGMSGKPIWMNEFGATAYDFSPGYSAEYSCSELKQAGILTANYALSLSEDPAMKAFWFCTYDPRDPAKESDWTWDAGIGVLYLGFLPKLSYAALAGVGRELDGRACAGRAVIPEDRPPDEALGLQQVSFAGPLAVVWADHPERAAAVPATELGCLAQESIEVRDAFTNPVTSGLAGELTLDLSRGPLYLEGSAQLAGIARAEQAVSLQAAEVAVLPGTTARVEVQAPAGVEVTADVEPILPLEARMTEAESGARVVELAAAAEAQRAAGMLTVRAHFSAGEIGLVAPLVVQRILPVSIGEANLLRDGGLQTRGLPHWTPERQSAYSWDAAVGHGAPGSLRLEGPFDRRLVHWGIVTVVDQDTRLSAWVKTEALSGATLTLNMAFFGADKWLGSWCLAATGPVGDLEEGWRVLPGLGRLPTGTSDWTHIEAVLPAGTIPNDTVKAAFYIDAKDGGSGTVWLDDLDLWQSAPEP